MARSFFSKKYRRRDKIVLDPQLLDQCHTALVEASLGSGPTLRALIDIGRLGQKVIPDSTRVGPLPVYDRGSSAIKLAARRLGEHGRTFRTSMKIVGTFSQATLEMFLTQRCRSGRLVTIPHVRAIMRLETEDLRAELINSFYQHSSSPAELHVQARKLLGPRCRESPRFRRFFVAVNQLSAMARMLTMNLDGPSKAFLLAPLCDWADGRGTPGPAELWAVADLHKAVLALQSRFNPAVEILGRTKEALEKRLGAAESGRLAGR